MPNNTSYEILASCLEKGKQQHAPVEVTVLFEHIYIACAFLYREYIIKHKHKKYIIYKYQLFIFYYHCYYASTNSTDCYP